MNAIDNTNSDIGFNIPNTYYEYQNQFCDPQVNKVQVWIETKRDFNFWNSILQGRINNTEFNIQSTETFVEDGKVATGCSRILFLVESGNIILGKNSIVCIDSDYHCISNLIEKSFDNTIPIHKAIDLANSYSNNFIFRTLVHSKESAFYKSEFLIDTIDFCTSSNKQNLKFCFDKVQIEISIVIKKYFISILNLYKKNKIDIDERGRLLKQLLIEISKINQLSSDYFVDCDSFKSSQVFIDLQKNVDALFFILDKKYPEDLQNIDVLLNNLKSFSIDDSNLLLFLKGHNISDLISGISNTYIQDSKKEATKQLRIYLLSKNCTADQIDAQIRDLSGCYRTNIIPSIFDRNYQNIHKNQYIKMVFDCIEECISS
ncbi:hypothetical protein D7V68_03555 [Acinetobacter cumulans]|uniref:hypothetical protein n=1 Tax=Acinetobacter cumulans TaxID=2136182 RepID=UPI000EA2DE9F|nr:hypothetical protein [Acinetobacter cumulans]RKG50336.1 hypothetical protein D7V68_03555 [Acinetobacter cumulans]